MMPEMIQALWDRKPVRYIAVGGGAFVVNFAIFLGLEPLMDVRFAEAIARSLATVLTFFGHKHVTFRAEDGQADSAAKQGVGYLVLAAVNVLISPWVVFYAVDLLGHVVAGKFVSEVIMTVEAYLLSALIFRPKAS